MTVANGAHSLICPFVFSKFRTLASFTTFCIKLTLPFRYCDYLHLHCSARFPMASEHEDWPAAKVRQTFIDYFTQKPGYEHTFWPSSNVVPHDDPSLLFVNAVSGSSLHGPSY
jgi:hypothetical protein